jgi:cell division protein FtsW (lipid II flippase)
MRESRVADISNQVVRRWFALVAFVATVAGVVGFAVSQWRWWAWIAIAALALLVVALVWTLRDMHAALSQEHAARLKAEQVPTAKQAPRDEQAVLNARRTLKARIEAAADRGSALAARADINPMEDLARITAWHNETHALLERALGLPIADTFAMASISTSVGVGMLSQIKQGVATQVKYLENLIAKSDTWKIMGDWQP